MLASPAGNRWAAAMARYIVAILLLVNLVGPAFAQSKQPDSLLELEDQEKKRDAAGVDKQYKSTLKNTDKTATPARTDPWQNMRGANDSKTKR